MDKSRRYVGCYQVSTDLFLFVLFIFEVNIFPLLLKLGGVSDDVVADLRLFFRRVIVNLLDGFLV